MTRARPAARAKDRTTRGGTNTASGSRDVTRTRGVGRRVYFLPFLPLASWAARASAVAWRGWNGEWINRGDRGRVSGDALRGGARVRADRFWNTRGLGCVASAVDVERHDGAPDGPRDGTPRGDGWR